MIQPLARPADPFEEAYAQAGPATRAFLEHAAARPEACDPGNFGELRAAGEAWGCNLQPWPVLADRDGFDRMAAAAVAVSQLVRALPRRLFGDDTGRISRYYELHDPALTALIVDEPNGFGEALGRGDFVLTAEGPRCVELNMGSHLGGWQHHRVAGAYLRHPLLAPFFAALGERVTSSDLLPVLLEHLIEGSAAAASDTGPEGELNVVFVLPDEAAGSADLARFDAEAAPRFATLLAARGLRGGLHYLPYSRLEEREGRLWFRHQGAERRVHAVVEVEEGETARHAFRCFKAGGIRLYNGLSSAVLSDKRNLALLSALLSENDSENGEPAAFSPEEREAIRRFVPWTRAVCPRYVRYRGERVFLPDFLAARRRSLVLKPARGTAGGEGVVMGPRATEAEWAAAVRRALAERWWIAQEHVEPVPRLALAEQGPELHDVVWGLFVFGSRFAGATARMLPRRVGGVVNAARGARESPVFIVEPQERDETP